MGEVRRLYIEANGEFTLLKQTKAGPGLLLIPESDSFSTEFQKAESQYACTRCGNVWEGERECQSKCANCNHNSWSQAVLIPEIHT
jgi:hypothetical protein